MSNLWLGSDLVKRIGLYGGTFDPIHFGHINLIIQLKESCDLNEVWVYPAQLSPLRQVNTPAHHRLEMVRLAFQEISWVKVLSIETSRPAPSYTIDTLNFLLEEHPNIQFYLILGSDVIETLPKWKEIDQIVKKIPFLIGQRGVPSASSVELPSYLDQAIQKGIQHIPIFDITATLVRKRISEELYCGHLVPAKVLDYIRKNQLYCNAAAL